MTALPMAWYCEETDRPHRKSVILDADQAATRKANPAIWRVVQPLFTAPPSPDAEKLRDALKGMVELFVDMHNDDEDEVIAALAALQQESL